MHSENSERLCAIDGEAAQIWILSRRRFCIDQDNNLVCAIEEIQRGHWKERKDSKNQFLNGINNPICAHEKSFETCDIEIVP